MIAGGRGFGVPRVKDLRMHSADWHKSRIRPAEPLGVFLEREADTGIVCVSAVAIIRERSTP